MNQQESTVKLVVQALDASVEDLDADVIRRLTVARERAVAAMQPQWQTAGHTGVFHNLGNYVGHHRLMTSVALLLGALVLGFIVTQHVIGQQQLEQGDAFLLGSELPPEAYLDKGFDTWLQQNALGLLLLVLLSGPAWAEDSKSVMLKWSQLTEDQRKVLTPLSKEWDTLRPWQREKMLDIARDYPKMNAKQQARVQQRLNDWSRMTPFERENARKKYQQFQSLPPEKQEELRKKWREYQSLPEAQREGLRREQPDLYDANELDN